jgi:hypothetical protein
MTVSLIGLQQALRNRINEGDMLRKLKDSVDHGQWLPILAKLHIAERRAQHYMRLAKHRALVMAKSDSESDFGFTDALEFIRQHEEQHEAKPVVAEQIAATEEAAAEHHNVAWCGEQQQQQQEEQQQPSEEEDEEQQQNPHKDGKKCRVCGVPIEEIYRYCSTKCAQQAEAAEAAEEQANEESQAQDVLDEVSEWETQAIPNYCEHIRQRRNGEQDYTPLIFTATQKDTFVKSLRACAHHFMKLADELDTADANNDDQVRWLSEESAAA